MDTFNDHDVSVVSELGQGQFGVIEDRTNDFEEAHFHAMMYTLGDRYLIQGHKDQYRKLFADPFWYFGAGQLGPAQEASWTTSDDEFAVSIYESTPAEDRGLRDILLLWVQRSIQHKNLMSFDRFRSTLEKLPSLSTLYRSRWSKHTAFDAPSAGSARTFSVTSASVESTVAVRPRPALMVCLCVRLASIVGHRG